MLVGVAMRAVCERGGCLIEGAKADEQRQIISEVQLVVEALIALRVELMPSLEPAPLERPTAP